MHKFRAMNAFFFTAGLPELFRRSAMNWFIYVENKLSRFRPDSELSALNRSNGRPFTASSLLYNVVSEANLHYQQTEGLFSPYLGAALCELGYSRSFETLTVPSKTATASHNADGIGPRPAGLNEELQRITLEPGVSVDLGGFAKGWSAHRFALKLQQQAISPGAIGAGGDISLWGTPREGWHIGIADPWQEEQNMLKLHLHGTLGIATSSSLKRQWTDTDGKIVHHIIDPRRGTPSDSDLAQVTVLAPNLPEAEVCAKCVLILGAEEGARWLRDRYPLSAMIGIKHDRSIVVSGTLDQYNAAKGGIPYELIS
ncbi:FAD:protein FMN transferase [Paenibacillus macerans]|uniref:FAD:protein FMN transferase n=1 Tax=Paenibacillus macerans TaxID=44252 RepID=UPI00203D88E8|nr:FAD:protein FMN transferase [Paenibacillus macerans]MCM3702786.1 FAD:protein FMN transferase [Paenibacillus macerans]